VQVINLSLGGASPSSILESAINYAYNQGVILVASTGNQGNGYVLYPAAYPPVIAVAATDSSNAWASFSNYGPEVDVAAPGVMIYSTYPGGGYGYRSGTSMSAPHVAGLAALLRGIPGNTPTQVIAQIESTALDLGTPGWDMYYGFGLIQMDAAVQAAWPTPTPTSIPSATFTNTPEISYYFPPASTPILLASPITASPTYFSTTLRSWTITPDQTLLSSADVPGPSATATPINTPQSAREKPTFLPTTCIGIVLIIAGLGLFWFAVSVRHGHQRRRPPGNRRLKFSKGH
jgi:subtilisin family serine protease